jgi:hypothetical protein
LRDSSLAKAPTPFSPLLRGGDTDSITIVRKTCQILAFSPKLD